jgi:hypothetical protein
MLNRRAAIATIIAHTEIQKALREIDKLFFSRASRRVLRTSSRSRSLPLSHSCAKVYFSLPGEPSPPFRRRCLTSSSPSISRSIVKLIFVSYCGRSARKRRAVTSSGVISPIPLSCAGLPRVFREATILQLGLLCWRHCCIFPRIPSKPPDWTRNKIAHGLVGHLSL